MSIYCYGCGVNMDKIMKNHMSLQQQILFYIYKKSGKPTKIEELKEELNMPRSTVVLHLHALERDGLVAVAKDGKEKLYFPVQEVHKEVYEGLAALHTAYVSALTAIRKKELKEMEKS